MTAGPGTRGTEAQDEKRNQRRGLLAWFVLVLFSVCILFACAQIAGLSILNPPQDVDLRSNMQADYSPWGYVAFGPINPQILIDILGDLKIDQLEIPVISDSCLIPGSCPTATATPQPTQTDTPTITLTPSDTPTPSMTPTASNTFTLTPTATRTPTPTPLIYPIKLANPDKVDPELNQTVQFTILVINYGSLPPAQLQTVCDFLPAGLTYVPNSADRSGSSTLEPCPGGGGDAVVWTPNESIPQGAFSRFTFQAQSDHPNAGDSFDNRVTAFGGNFNAATNHKTVYAYTPTPTFTPTTQPIAVDNSYGTFEDTPIAPVAPGVLGNDLDAPWDILQSYVVIGPSYGDLTLNTDGSFTYQTTPDWNGYDSFVYEACDQGGACSTAAVTLAVTPVPDAARATDDVYSVNEDNNLSVPADGLISNDVDPDNFPPTAANYGLSVVTPMPIATPIHGAVTVQADGAFDYVPNGDYYGGDVFSYRVCDINGCDLGDAHITVVPVDDAPAAVPDSATTNEDTPVDIPVIAGDASLNGQDTDIDNTNAELSVYPGSITNVQGGTVALISGNRVVRFTPSLNLNDFNTASFGFDYRAYDGTLPSAGSAHVTISVLPVDDTPVPVNDIYATPFSQFGGPYTLNVLANDTDPVEGDPLHIESIPNAPNNPAVIATPGLDAIIYDPNPTGTATPFHSPTTPDTFTYQVCDTNNDGATPESACATAQVQVIVNDPPVAVDDNPDSSPTATPAAGNLVVYEDTTLNVSAADGVLSNDYDPNIPATDTLTAVLDTGPSHAAASPVFTFNADGSFTYRPELNYNSSIGGDDSFTYHVSDGGLTSGTATVTIRILPVNDLPVANDDPIASPPTASDPDPTLYIVDTGNTLSVSAADGVLANDTDVDNVLPTPPNAGLSAIPDTGPSHAAPGPGSFTLNADGSFDYTPRVNPTPFYGDDQFTYHANDGTAVSASPGTVTIHVNVPPVAVDDGDPTPIAVLESTARDIDVLANDTDLNNDPLSVASVTQGTHGTVTNNGSDVTYTPNPYYFGPDTFTYLANDGRLDSDPTSPATVYVNVTPVENSPVAVDDGSAGSPLVTMDEDTSTPPSIPTTLLLSNDTDPDNLTAPFNAGLFVQSVTSGTKDTVVLDDNGTPGDPSDDFVTYTPDANANGIDTFQYQVCDPTARCDTGTVTVQVNPVNDPPVASPDAYTVGQGDSLTPAAPGVLGNDSDVESDPLTAVLDSGPSHDSGFALNSDGSFSYSPDVTFHGTDTFTYHANDGTDDSNTTTVSILVDDPPVADDDAYVTDEDTPLNVTALVGVLAGDTDPNGDALTANKLTDPNHGSVTLNSDGSFGYLPDSNYNSPMGGDDSFTYEACDPLGLCDTATVTITINPVNDAPTASSDGPYNTYDNPGGPENNSPVAPLDTSPVSVLDNDGDFDGPLPLHAVLVSPPSHAYSLNAADFELRDDGTFVYNAADGYTGADSFSYQACDSYAPAACSSTTTVDLYVDSLPVANDDPVATPPTANDPPASAYQLDEDSGPLTVSTADGVLANDSDANLGDTLTAVLDSDVTDGSLTLNPDGSFTYDPDLDFYGSDSFTYHVNDGYFDSTTEPTASPATVTITVTAVNDAPRAGNDSYSLDEDTTLAVNASDDPTPPLGLLANDIEPDGQAMAVTTTAVSGPSHAQSFALNSNGSFTYQPVSNYYGPDSFVYEVCDNTSPTPLCDTGTANLTINNVMDVPVSSGDTYTTNEDSPLTVTSPGVLGNDSDADNLSPTPAHAGLTASLVDDVTHGSLTLNSDGSFTYSPAPNYYGPDGFTYRACDSVPLCSPTTTVGITINPVDDTPVANADSYSMDEDTTLTVNAADDPTPPLGVIANDTDPDNLTAQFNAGLSVDPTPVATPVHAQSFSLSSNGSFTYQPVGDYNGLDQFQYRLCDTTLPTPLCDVGTVDLTINNVNDAPVAVDDGTLSPFTTAEDTPITLTTLLDNDTDVDGDTLSIADASGATHGSLSHAATTVTYTPSTDYNGDDSFTYQLCDNGSPVLCDTATVYVTVTAVDDQPTAVDDSYTISQLTLPTVLPVLNNDSDPVEGDTIYIDSAQDPSDQNGSVLVSGGSPPTTITYNPNGYHSPTAPDTFTYTLCDTGSPPYDGPCPTANVSVIINDPPTANDDPATPGDYTIDEGGSLSVSSGNGVLANDTDPNGDPMTAVHVSGPAHASSFALNADGSFSYTPQANWNGTDTFTYYATDGGMDSANATVTLTVNPINDAPQANPDDAGTIDQGGSTITDVLSNDSDVEGRLDPSSVIVSTPPARGSTSVNPTTGAITFTDAAVGGPQTQVTYTYQVCDANTDLVDGPGGALCDSATVTVHFTRPQLTVQLDPDSATPSAHSSTTFTASFWNDGPGTAFNVQVNISIVGSCTLQTGNPIYSGDMGDGAAAFKDVRVRSGGDGTHCDITASISSDNGTPDSDMSTIDVPAAAPAAAPAAVSGGSGALSPTPAASPTPTWDASGGGGASNGSATATGTPATASATPASGVATATAATADPDATPTETPPANSATDTPVAASATPGGGLATDTPVPALATDTAVPASATVVGSVATDTPAAPASDTPVPAAPSDTPAAATASDTAAAPPASPSDTPKPQPTATEQPVVASSAGPTDLSGSGLWLWLQLLLPLAWLGWMLGMRKDRKGQDNP